MQTLIVDNDDSFTQILAHLIAEQLGNLPKCVNYQAFTDEMLDEIDWLIISPGPGHPTEYTRYYPSIQAGQIPTLGICLGMQIINTALGGSVDMLSSCVHGFQDSIFFESDTYTVGRYHSLYATQLGSGLDLLTSNKDGIPMVIKHTEKPLLGYQFHPESFLTKNGSFFIQYAYDHLFQVAV